MNGNKIKNNSYNKNIINIFIFIAVMLVAWGVFGHLLGLYSKIAFYDKLLHMLCSGLTVFIGAQLCDIFNGGNDGISPLMKTVHSFSVSCIAIVCFAIFEFFCDYYIPNSHKLYGFPYEKNSFFFVLFGHSVNEELQKHVFDLDISFVADIFGAAVCAVILHIILNKNKKTKDSERKQERYGDEKLEAVCGK